MFVGWLYLNVLVCCCFLPCSHGGWKLRCCHYFQIFLKIYLALLCFLKQYFKIFSNYPVSSLIINIYSTSHNRVCHFEFEFIISLQKCLGAYSMDVNVISDTSPLLYLSKKYLKISRRPLGFDAR